MCSKFRLINGSQPLGGLPWNRLARLTIPTLPYKNLPMQYTEIFSAVKTEKFHPKIFDIFLIFAQNIDCGYKLEPPHQGGSNRYPQSMF